jgi:hypothetical protein
MLLIEIVAIVVSAIAGIGIIIVSAKVCEKTYSRSNITTSCCNGPYRTPDVSNLIPDTLKPKSLSLVEMLMLGKWRRKYSDGETYFVLGRPAKFTLSPMSLSVRTGVFGRTFLNVLSFEQRDLWNHCCKESDKQILERNKKLNEKAKRAAKKLVRA